MILPYIDIHCHLDDEQFTSDIDQVITRATDTGCLALLSASIDEQTIKKTLDLAKKYPVIKPVLGLYPQTVETLSDEKITEILVFIQKINPVAIGEIGLDFKYTTDKALQEKQQLYFEKQLELAQMLQKPSIIHSRGAEVQVLQQIQKRKNCILHCYCGEIQRAVDSSAYVSIPVRACGSKSFQKLISAIPLTRLLTETDAPYLNDGRQRNEPQNILRTIQLIAEIKNISVQECATQLIVNAKNIGLFQK
jgi:TatD DNase family protein